MSHCKCLSLPLRIAAPALVPVVILFASCKKEKQAGPAQMSPTEVSFIEIKTESVTLKKELPGRTTPYMVAEIRPQASGIITKRLFTEGTDVQMGDVLYEIDPSNYEAAKNSAEAALNVAKANHSTSIAALGAVRATLSAAKAAQSRAIANAEPLRLRTARFQELLSSKAVSQQDYDDSAAALKQAEAGIDSAAAGVISAEADIQRAEAAVKAAEAAIETAEAALANAEINLAYTKITAPIPGRIGRSAVTTGALVTAHQPLPLAIIQQLNPIYVDVPQATAELLQLRRRLADGRLSLNGSYGGQASLLLEDNSEYELKGMIQFREVSVNPTTGSSILRLVFANPQNELLPGMFVRAVINEGTNNNAILVPQQCVSRNMRGDAMTMIIGANNTVEVKMLQIDRAIGNRWLVSDGLKAGDRVIVEGLQRIRPGSVVNPVPEAQTPAAATTSGAEAPAPTAADSTSAAPAANNSAAANADSTSTTK